MNRKILLAGAAGAFALAGVAIAQTAQQPVNPDQTPAAGAYSADTAAQAPAADQSATDTATTAGERG